MHALRTILLGFAGLTIPALSSAGAVTLVPVTPPAGTVSAIVFGINHHDVVAGEYMNASGVEQGFTGPVNGTYTIINYGGASTATEPRAIDDSDTINGFAQVPGFTFGEEFLYETDGTFLTFEKNGVPLDGSAQGITKFRTSSTGDYVDPDTGIRTGYLGRDGNYVSDVNLGLAVTQTSPRAINKHGTLAGFYVDESGATHGFILKNGIAQTVDADNSGTTVLEGINSKDVATGFTTDTSGNRHAFVYDDATGTFTSIVINDGSPYTEAWGIDDDGMIGTSTSMGTYIYCLSNVHCPKGGHATTAGRTWTATSGPIHPIHVKASKGQARP